MKLVVAALLGSLGSAGCSGATPIAVAPRAPARPLLAYGGVSADLFDDGIDLQPAHAGAEPGASPAANRLLRDRIELGDCVARVRAVTVTSTRDGSEVRWRLGLHTLEPIAGDRRVEPDWTLSVREDGAAGAALRSLEGRLVGRTFIAFFREFAASEPGEPGEPGELHFHLAVEDDDELGAVRVAALLAQVK